MNGLNEEFEGQVDVVFLNAALKANAELQTGYGLRGHPAFVLVDESGSVEQQFIGPQTAEVLRQAMLELVGP